MKRTLTQNEGSGRGRLTDHIDEFSDIVREAAEQAGEEFVVFTTSDGHQGYSQMFVMPLDAVDAR